MGATHGKNGRVYIDEYDFTTFCQSVGLDLSIDVVDKSAFSDDSKEYLLGLNDGTISADGNFDDDNDASREILDSIKGNNAIISYYPALDTKGNYGYGMQAKQTNYGISESMTEQVKFALSSQVDGGEDRIISIIPKTTITDNGSTTALDLGAGGSDGGVLYVHITAITGTVTVTIEDSADNISFATLHDLGAVSAVAGSRIVLAGNIDRYVRVTTSNMSSESVTIQAGIKVN